MATMRQPGRPAPAKAKQPTPARPAPSRPAPRSQPAAVPQAQPAAVRRPRTPRTPAVGTVTTTTTVPITPTPATQPRQRKKRVAATQQTQQAANQTQAQGAPPVVPPPADKFGAFMKKNWEKLLGGALVLFLLGYILSGGLTSPLSFAKKDAKPDATIKEVQKESLPGVVVDENDGGDEISPVTIAKEKGRASGISMKPLGTPKSSKEDVSLGAGGKRIGKIDRNNGVAVVNNGVVYGGINICCGGSATNFHQIKVDEKWYDKPSDAIVDILKDDCCSTDSRTRVMVIETELPVGADYTYRYPSSDWDIVIDVDSRKVNGVFNVNGTEDKPRWVPVEDCREVKGIQSARMENTSRSAVKIVFTATRKSPGSSST